MKYLEAITDEQAIKIAELALDDKMRNPVVHSFIDYGVKIIKVVDEYPEPLTHIDDLEKSLFDWVEIDESLTVRERHNTLCNMVEICKYFNEIGLIKSDRSSQVIIGRVKERHKELEEKAFDWRSFYHGWLEGRADLLKV